GGFPSELSVYSESPNWVPRFPFLLRLFPRLLSGRRPSPALRDEIRKSTVETVGYPLSRQRRSGCAKVSQQAEKARPSTLLRAFTSPETTAGYFSYSRLLRLPPSRRTTT